MTHVGSLLLGLGNGGVFAAFAVALVITYRSSGVVNFATGAIALFVAYTYAGLRRGELLVIIPGLPKTVDIGSPMSLGPAIVVSLIVAAALGAILYGLVFYPLRAAPPLAKAVASLGVLIVLQGALAIRVGTQPVSVKGIFPSGRWELGSIFVLSDRLYLVIAVLGMTLILIAAYRYTRFGLLTRAVAETQTGAFVSGVSPNRIALINWMVSAVVAGAAGILIAPLSPLTPITYTLFVVPALAAAVIGKFQNLLPAAIAGIVIGMLQSEAISLSAQYSWFPSSGSSELVPLVVVLFALLAIGRGLPVRGGITSQPLGRAPRPRTLWQPTLMGSAIGLIALLATQGTWRAAVIGSFIAAVIALSLVVVTGYAGQVSLAQLALAGTAAFTLSFLTQSWGIPFPIAPLIAAGISTVIGVAIGMPALRLRGLMLGVVTLTLAYAIEAVWFRNADIVSSSGAKVDSPSIFGVDLGIGTGAAFPRIHFGILCLATLVVIGWGVARLRLSALGSAMLAVRANERSAAGVGVNVVKVKVLSFAIASFIAGIGGCLLAYRRGVVSFDSFTAIGGLAVLSSAYLAGVTSVWGGVLAGILASSGIVFIAADRWLHVGAWFAVITGVLLIATLIGYPEGLAHIGHAIADRRAARRQRRIAASAPVPPSATSTGEVRIRPPASAGDHVDGSNTVRVLDVHGLRVRYGGVVAVNDASLHVDAGTVVGLIGPNGAGKTSVVDAITGFAASSGRIEFMGKSVTELAPHARVRAGLARTFQSLELYDDLSVRENVSVSTFESGGADDVTEALDRLGIDALAERTAGELSQGERQLVSIARACAAHPGAILLDEPAAGLDSSETVWLGERIRDIAAGGTAVLLIDHDVALVLGVCNYVYVLDFGVVIAEGTPDEIRGSRLVADAYLGTMHDDGEVTA